MVCCIMMACIDGCSWSSGSSKHSYQLSQPHLNYEIKVHGIFSTCCGCSIFAQQIMRRLMWLIPLLGFISICKYVNCYFSPRIGRPVCGISQSFHIPWVFPRCDSCSQSRCTCSLWCSHCLALYIYCGV
jgi:hypothetical protein